MNSAMHRAGNKDSSEDDNSISCGPLKKSKTFKSSISIGEVAQFGAHLSDADLSSRLGARSPGIEARKNDMRS